VEGGEEDPPLPSVCESDEEGPVGEPRGDDHPLGNRTYGSSWSMRIHSASSLPGVRAVVPKGESEAETGKPCWVWYKSTSASWRAARTSALPSVFPGGPPGRPTGTATGMPLTEGTASLPLHRARHTKSEHVSPSYPDLMYGTVVPGGGQCGRPSIFLSRALRGRIMSL
jgi:hypothetical protein